MIITVDEAIKLGIWEKLCKLKDIDYWVTLNHEIELTQEETKQLGLVKKGVRQKMIMAVVKVLKKHLDEAYDNFASMWEGLEISPYNILQENPDQYQLRRLAHELIGVIRGTDVSKLVSIPTQAETMGFLKSNVPMELDDESLAYMARELRVWLCGFKRAYFEGAKPVFYQVSERLKIK